MNTVPLFPDERARCNLVAKRTELLAAAIAYVKDGRIGTVGDRLREASDATGIPLTLIEVEIKK